MNGLSPSEQPRADHTSKIELRVAWLTLFTAILGFVASGFALYKQNQDIKSLRDELRNIDSLRDSLRMPIEGTWSFRLDYTKYAGNDASQFADGKPYMSGKANFVWHHTSEGGYHYKGYLGGAVLLEGKGDDALVTALSLIKLDTAKSGIPEDGFRLAGKYIYRTAKGHAPTHPPRVDFEYENCKFDKTVTPSSTFTCQFSSKTAQGSIGFTRD